MEHVDEHTIAARSGGTPRTIGVDLERLRLEHRARRMGFAIAALREIADARATNGAPPPALRQAIDGFSCELAQVRRRIAEL